MDILRQLSEIYSGAPDVIQILILIAGTVFIVTIAVSIFSLLGTLRVLIYGIVPFHEPTETPVKKDGAQSLFKKLMPRKKEERGGDVQQNRSL